jgi:hypothetical protein
MTHIHSLYTILNDRKISKKSSCLFRGQAQSLLHGVRGKFLTAIQSLYNEVKCTVRINNDLTPWFNVEAGVKQVSVYVPRNFVHDETHFAHHIKCYYFQAKNSIDDSKYYSKFCKVPRLRLLLQVVLRAKLRKAAGIDDIPAEVLKNDVAGFFYFK